MRPVGPPPELLGLAALLLLVPAALALRARPRRGVAEAALCALTALPLALVSGAIVRALEDRWGENLSLPWDAGLVPAYGSAMLAALGVVGALSWARRRARLVD